MDNEKTGQETNDQVGCFQHADWLSRTFLDVALDVDVEIELKFTNGVSTFILPMFLNGLFFDFSLFSHSDSYVDI